MNRLSRIKWLGLKGLTKLQSMYYSKRYKNKPYREFYSKVMRKRTTKDPKMAVGGQWDSIGELQLNFLCQKGLKSHHTLLDVGCGSLRGGLHFIKYLDAGGYMGIDISQEILNAGKGFLKDAELEYKNPVLQINRDLTFNGFENKKFDFILAQSVLSHMPLSDIEECFANIHKVMHEETLFFATFHDGGDRTYTPDYINFYYPFPLLRDLGAKHHLEIQLSPDYKHPRKQKMMSISFARVN